MATLTITNAYEAHFPPYDDPTGITDIVFQTSTATSIALFDAYQFDDVHISSTVHITGDANANEIHISTFGAPDNSFSAAGWTFDNWDSADIVSFFGTDDNDTIVGSAFNDVIQSNDGGDALYGGAGNDTFLFNAYGELPFVPADVVDGGDDFDVVAYSDFTPDQEAFFYFMQFNEVEELDVAAYLDGSITLYFSDDQIGGTGGFTTVKEVVSGGQFNLIVKGHDVDLSNVAFINWTAGIFNPANTITIDGQGTTAGTLIGSELNDTIIGGDQGDTLDGGESADSMAGGMATTPISSTTMAIRFSSNRTQAPTRSSRTSTSPCHRMSRS